MAKYVYGMRMRGFAPACQPMRGLVDWCDADKGDRYYSYLTYDRKLSAHEKSEYELDFLYEED